LNSNTKGASKRRPNLTYEELDAIATEKGVQELYRYAVANLEVYFQKHTTRSSIGFTSLFNGRRKSLVSFIPQQSNASDGLRFQLYSLRLRTLFGLSEDSDLAMLPSRRDPWIYYETAGPDYEMG